MITNFKTKKAFSILVQNLITLKHFFRNDLRIYGLTDETLKFIKELPMILEYAKDGINYIEDRYSYSNIGYIGDKSIDEWIEIIEEQIRILEPVAKKIIKGKELYHSEEIKFIEIIDEKNISDKSYEEVVAEINGTYNDEYFASMYILVRKLLENLLYDCLKAYYGTQDVDKYYNTGKNRHQGYGVLIENFNVMIHNQNFKTMVVDFDQKFIDLLKEFQETGNSNAHSLFNLAHQDFIEERKDKINNLIKKLDWVLKKIINNNKMKKKQSPY